MKYMEIRKILIEKIHNNNWDYDEYMAQSNAPTPDERLADSILEVVVQLVIENMIRHEPVGNGDKWREEVFTTFGWNAALDKLANILKGKRDVNTTVGYMGTSGTDMEDHDY